MKLTTIIVFLFPVVVARHSHRTILESILKPKDNLYAKVDSDVQNVMNNLFNELNLAPTFPAKTRIKLLLTMHYNLNSMAEKNYDGYEKMIEVARPDTAYNGSKGFALFKLIEKTLDDEPFKLSVKLKEKKTSRKLTIRKNRIVQRATTISTTTATATALEDIRQSDPVFADSKEFLKFIKDFIKKVDKLNETDFSKSTPLLPPIDEDNTQPDLDVWEPTAFNNFNDSNTRRIYKGKRSRVKSYPFVVSIHLMEMFVCAGSIISSDLIITAASCLQILHNNRFFRENPKTVEVRVGSDYFSRGGETIPVLESYFYPSYDPKNLANNLVILRLMRHIGFHRNEKKVKKILFDRTRGNLASNTEGITVVGWGSRKHNNLIDQFEKMMVAKLDIYHIDECANIYGKQYVTNRHFCAGYIATGGGACNKDLGGPGVVGGLLTGVISFGAPMCGAIDAPTVFTKLGYYTKWIDSIIKQSGPLLSVRTTLKFNTDKNYFYDPTPPPRENPYFSYTTIREEVEPPIRTERTMKYEPGVRRRTTPRTQIQQLFPYTPTTRHSMLLPMQLLRSILYGDYGLPEDDVSDMFKTTRDLESSQHPLVNLSIFAIPGVHTSATQTQTPKRFATRPTTLSTLKPIPTNFTFAMGTSTVHTQPTSSAASNTTDHNITDLFTPGPSLELDWTTTSKPVSPETASTTVGTTAPNDTEVKYYYN